MWSKSYVWLKLIGDFDLNFNQIFYKFGLCTTFSFQMTTTSAWVRDAKKAMWETLKTCGMWASAPNLRLFPPKLLIKQNIADSNRNIFSLGIFYRTR